MYMSIIREAGTQLAHGERMTNNSVKSMKAHNNLGVHRMENYG